MSWVTVKRAVGRRTLGVHAPLGDHFTVEVGELLQEPDVLQQRSSGHAHRPAVIKRCSGLKLDGTVYGRIVPAAVTRSAVITAIASCTLVLARDCPLLVAPAMNRQMWENPATVRNVATLRGDGVLIVGPGSGDQACGESGPGRMLEAEEIRDALVAYFQPKLLAGKRLLLTAGPTFEAIDPVRGITNLSSGKMGYAISRAAHEGGGAGDAGFRARRSSLSGGSQARFRDQRLADARGGAQAGRRERRLHRRGGRRRLPAGTGRRAENQEASAGLAADHRAGRQSGHPRRSRRAAHGATLRRLCRRKRESAEYAESKRRSKRSPLIVGNLIQDGFGGDRTR
jgi:phosphopantothenoylcysteine decarboxylase/phosphopantothenate--cysteine ligase